MKKTHQVLWIIAAFLLGSRLDAQSTSFGLKGGISIPSLEAGGSGNYPLSRGYRSSFGPDAALVAVLQCSDVFSVQSELEYSTQGARRNGLQAFPVPASYATYFNPGTILYANFKAAVKLSYIMLPVMAKFQWNFNSCSPFHFYVEGGPFVGQLLASKLVTSGHSNVYADPAGQQPLLQMPLSFDTTANIESQLHTTNFGAEANAGLSYHWGHSDLFIEGGANYGFLNIQQGTANGRNTTGAVAACLGCVFTFHNKDNRTKFRY